MLFRRGVDVQWVCVKVLHGDGLLGIFVVGQEAVVVVGEAHLVAGELVHAAEPVSLVQAMLSDHGCCGMLFERRMADGLEGGVIDALEVPLAIELLHSLEDVPV